MSTISSTQAVSTDVAEHKDMVRALILDRKNQTPPQLSSPLKALNKVGVTVGAVIPIKTVQPLTATNKEKLSALARTSPLNENCFAVTSTSYQRKLGDPGRFPDSYVNLLTGIATCNALADLDLRKELKLCEAKTVESSVDEPPEVELKELPPHLEYAFLEGDNKLPVIIAKDLKDEEKAALLKVLKSHKRAIAWKLSRYRVDPIACQDFDIEIRDKKGAENLAADHLSRLENPHQDKLENKETMKPFSSRNTCKLLIALKED
ncbi:hypothetical protein Tco_0003079 [Tanacetum coccineum]